MNDWIMAEIVIILVFYFLVIELCTYVVFLILFQVFRVFLKWSDDFNSGLVDTEEFVELKDNLLKLENTILPILGDRWVSLHPSYGLICWSDDDKLKQQFKHCDGVEFLNFNELGNQEKEVLSEKVANFLQKLGVPPLSQVSTWIRAYTSDCIQFFSDLHLAVLFSGCFS